MSSADKQVMYNPGPGRITEQAEATLKAQRDMISGDSQTQNKLTAIDFASRLRELKLELIVQVGRLEYAEADARVRLAQIQLDKAETEKLAVKVSQIETRLDIFVLEQDTKDS